MFTKSISSLVGRILAALTIVTLAVGIAPVQPAYAVAAQLNNWTLAASVGGTGLNQGTINAGNITVSAGANRLFIGAVCMELSGPNTFDALSMSLGGTALTLVGSTIAVSGSEHCYMGYLLDANIPAGSNALTVPYDVANTTSTVNGAHVYWASYSGIDQTNPIRDANPNSNGSTSVTFGAQIDYLLDGVTFYVAGNIATPDTMTAPGTFSQQLATTSNGHSSFIGRITTVPHAASGNYAAATNVSFSVPSGGNRSAIVVASLRPYVAYNITSSVGAGTGTITPLGAGSYAQDSNQTFDIVPGADNVVSGVSVDGGASVGRVNHHTFTNIQAAHTIVATFDGGWSAPGASANVNSVDGADNIFSSNDVYAAINNSGDSVNYTTFGLSIPGGSTINGIEVAIEGYSEGTRNVNVRLSWDNGGSFTPTTYTTTMPTSTSASEATVILGGSGDTWGRTWSASDFSDGSFVVLLTGTADSATLYLDQLQVKVYYTANNTPSGTDNTIVVVEDGSHAFVANDFGFTDPDAGDTMSAVRIDTLPAAGSLTLSAVPLTAGQVILTADIPNLLFTPASNANGSPYASFTFSVRDANGSAYDATPNTMTLNVTAVDDPSDAADDFAGVAEDSAATTITVRENDSDIEDGTPTHELIVDITNPANNGTAVITNGGADLTYEPPLNFCSVSEETNEFTYTLEGGSTATVRVFVECINDEPDFTASNPPPLFINAPAQTIPGWVTSFTPGPADESWQTVLTYHVSNNTCGTLLSVQPAVSTTGTLTYTPAAGQRGTCTFDVQVQDDGGMFNPGDDDTGPAHTFTITINDNTPPFVITIGSIPDTGDGHISENEIVWVNLVTISVTFNEDMFNPGGNSSPSDVTNPDNYLLLWSSVDEFSTTTCAGGVQAPDKRIPISSVHYNNNGGQDPFTALLTLETLLPNGFYRLIVCGTTSVMDLTGNKLAGNGTIAGTDFTRNFMLFASGNGIGGGGTTPTTSSGGAFIPVTGFPPNRVTTLTGPRLNYASSAVTIELPRLKLTLPVVGVPFKNGGWDVNWLTAQAGWLEHTAFPGLNGNSVLTSHITSPFGSAGPFANLGRMVVGDMIYVRNNGTLYIYQVEKVITVNPNETSIFKHEEKPWLTLVTCQEWDELLGTYLKRLVVRARLIGTMADPTFIQ